MNIYCSRYIIIKMCVGINRHLVQFSVAIQFFTQYLQGALEVNLVLVNLVLSWTQKMLC